MPVLKNGIFRFSVFEDSCLYCCWLSDGPYVVQCVAVGMLRGEGG